MSSRCPRPIGIIASMAISPVCRGSFTGCRNITPGALRSRGISSSSPSIEPRPSMGCPSGLMTRPTSPSPVGIEAILRVRFTMSPSLILAVVPSSTAPTLSSSRFITTALSPFSNSSNSPLSALLRPNMRTTPSDTCRTRPTSSNFTFVSMPSSCIFNTSDTSLTFILGIMSCLIF